MKQICLVKSKDAVQRKMQILYNHEVVGSLKKCLHCCIATANKTFKRVSNSYHYIITPPQSWQTKRSHTSLGHNRVMLCYVKS